MSIVVGLGVTSSFHTVAASMTRRSAFIVDIITELPYIFLIVAASVFDQEQPIIISTPSRSPYFTTNIIFI
jgi:hypothetical protein